MTTNLLHALRFYPSVLVKRTTFGVREVHTVDHSVAVERMIEIPRGIKPWIGPNTHELQKEKHELQHLYQS